MSVYILGADGHVRSVFGGPNLDDEELAQAAAGLAPIEAERREAAIAREKAKPTCDGRHPGGHTCAAASAA